MLFTDKILKNKIDDSVHKSLVRFSKGEFEGRGAMKISFPKGILKLTASYDLIKDITMSVANYADKIEIKGKVIKGKQKEELDEKVSGEDLKKLCEENSYVLLNLDFGEYSVKVGKNLPKPGKPPKNNFCKCILPMELLKELTDLKDFKKLEISNTIIIEEIIIPEEHKDDFEQARLNSKRKGKIIRKIIMDKKESEEKIYFEA
jgi:hypothetical protein